MGSAGRPSTASCPPTWTRRSWALSVLGDGPRLRLSKLATTGKIQRFARRDQLWTGRGRRVN